MTSSDNDQNPIVPEPAVSIRYIRNAAPAVTRNAITDSPNYCPETVFSTLMGQKISLDFRMMSTSELVRNTVTPP
jgi:hypothetical protein